MPEQSLEQRAKLGDVIAFTKKGSIEGWVISSFTENPFTHCALMVDENNAVSLSLSYKNLFKKAAEKEIASLGINYYEWIENLFRRAGLFNGTNITGLVTNLDVRNLPPEYDEWVILRHKEMTDEKRAKLKDIYDNTKIDGYDLDTFLRMAYRHSKNIKFKYNDLSTPLVLAVFLTGTLVSFFKKGQEDDSAADENLAEPSRHLCSNVISAAWRHIDLKVHPNVSWKRVEPPHYVESPLLYKIQRGKNPKSLPQKRYMLF